MRYMNAQALFVCLFCVHHASSCFYFIIEEKSRMDVHEIIPAASLTHSANSSSSVHSSAALSLSERTCTHEQQFSC